MAWYLVKHRDDFSFHSMHIEVIGFNTSTCSRNTVHPEISIQEQR